MDVGKIGLNIASLPGFSLHEAIRKTKELGFDAIELLAFEGARHSQGALAGFWFDELGCEEKQRLKRAVDGFSHVSVHAPFTDAPLFTYNRRIKEEAIRQVKESVDATSFLGGEITTVHANPKSFSELTEYWDEMLSTFRELGDYAGSRNIKIGIETGFPNTVEDYTDLILDINHPSVGATVDTGHTFVYVEEDVRGTAQGVEEVNRNLIRITTVLKDKLYHFHLHDIRKEDFRDHRVCGHGIIDFDALFKTLDEIAYKGLFMFELEEEEKERAVRESKAYIENLFM